MPMYVFPAQSVTIPGVATEATLLQVETNTANTVQELQDVNSELNSQTTALNSIDSKLSAPVSVSGPLTDAQLRASAVPVSASSLPLPSGAATEATLSNVQTAVNALNARTAGSLVPEEFDYQDITYVLAGNGQGEISTVVYKLGGSGGTTVATLTMAYDVNNKLTSVTRS